MRLSCLLAITTCSLVFAGCAKDDGLTEVRGTLYIGDQPSTKGMGYVTFHPDSSKGNTWQEESVGTIQPDGSYSLEMRGKKGAALGWYKVGVTLAEVIDPQNPYVTHWLMPNPEKYQSWNKSGIAIEVVENPPLGQYDIKLPPLNAAAK